MLIQEYLNKSKDMPAVLRKPLICCYYDEDDEEYHVADVPLSYMIVLYIEHGHGDQWDDVFTLEEAIEYLKMHPSKEHECIQYFMDIHDAELFDNHRKASSFCSKVNDELYKQRQEKRDHFHPRGMG